MTRDEVKTLTPALQAKLNEIGAALGVKLTLGRCTFGDTATYKLEAAPLKADGTADTKEMIEFRRWAALFGLKPEYLGKTFRGRDGRKFTVKGLNPKAPKRPVIADRDDGLTFCFPAPVIARALSFAGAAS
jgi:hypothetical protein